MWHRLLTRISASALDCTLVRSDCVLTCSTNRLILSPRELFIVHLLPGVQIPHIAQFQRPLCLELDYSVPSKSFDSTTDLVRQQTAAVQNGHWPGKTVIQPRLLRSLLLSSSKLAKMDSSASALFGKTLIHVMEIWFHMVFQTVRKISQRLVCTEA